ncbi:hypothetical protein IFM89_006546 [Coptis chinensis]|uniref:Uncharacterized protein n=1 Tax=Coptis chinensis TaxID=261450 RepID=A0A835MA29_9MAGN|nr:hypothetical protein IFM89_006546 [Coptis chinensis]
MASTLLFTRELISVLCYHLLARLRTLEYGNQLKMACLQSRKIPIQSDKKNGWAWLLGTNGYGSKTCTPE